MRLFDVLKWIAVAALATAVGLMPLASGFDLIEQRWVGLALAVAFMAWLGMLGTII